MFISILTKKALVEGGFGEALVSVLCDWYRESKEKSSDGKAITGHELFVILDEIADDVDALGTFIVDNMLSNSTAFQVLDWLWHKKAPSSVVIRSEAGNQLEVFDPDSRMVEADE